VLKIKFKKESSFLSRIIKLTKFEIKPPKNLTIGFQNLTTTNMSDAILCMKYSDLCSKIESLLNFKLLKISKSLI